MKKYFTFKHILFSSTIVLILLVSCNKWLDIAPENNLIKEKFWTKTADVNAALAATYSAFRSSAMESFIWGELRADMVKFGSDAFADYNRIAESDISPTNGKINWKNYYKAINLANTLMYYAPEVQKNDKTFTDKMKDGIDAEALFIRSLSYFYLVRLWKDVPLVLEPSISDTVNIYLPKSPENVVLKHVLSDLKVAKDKAYTTEFQDNTPYFKGRANKYSIMALMADIYLWSEQYQECINYCDEIINSNLYQLEPYLTWFNLYYPGNSIESIFEIQYNDQFDSQENPIYLILLGSIKLTNKVDMLLPKEDLRNCEGMGPDWKYIGTDLNGNERSGAQRDAHFIYYRLADILLMKAEALVELDNLTEANYLVSLIVERTGGSYIGIYDKKELRQFILDEKAREFAVEGKRWFDLLRAAKRNHFENKQLIINMILGSADIKRQAILRTKVFDTMSYYLPISQYEIDYNQKMIQNPFYER